MFFLCVYFQEIHTDLRVSKNMFSKSFNKYFLWVNWCECWKKKLMYYSIISIYMPLYWLNCVESCNTKHTIHTVALYVYSAVSYSKLATQFIIVTCQLVLLSTCEFFFFLFDPIYSSMFEYLVLLCNIIKNKICLLWIILDILL